MSIRTYYPLWFRLDRANGYFIWIAGEPGGVVLNDEKKIQAYGNIQLLGAHAKRLGLMLENEEPLLHDLDKVKMWLEPPEKRLIDCDAFLSAWNLFDDISVSLCGSKLEIPEAGSEEVNHTYIRVFHGNNLPAVTPEGRKFIPIWSESELALIKKVMEKGLRDFQNRLQIIT